VHISQWDTTVVLAGVQNSGSTRSMKMLMRWIAGGLASLWLATVVSGLLGRRRGAALAAALTAVFATTPFLARLLAYFSSPEEFVKRYGAAAVHSDVVIGGVCVALALVALIASPLAAHRRWGWTVSALFSLPPVMLVVWVAFWFRITF